MYTQLCVCLLLFCDGRISALTEKQQQTIRSATAPLALWTESPSIHSYHSQILFVRQTKICIVNSDSFDGVENKHKTLNSIQTIN